MGIPDLKLYLKLRIMKNLEKYDRILGEKCTLYDKSLQDIISTGLSEEELIN
jgi:hypothetical protein